MKRQIVFNNSAISIVSKYLLYKIKFDQSGIYIIRNNLTNECYIGQSVNMKRRIATHKRLLKRNGHKYTNGQPTLLQEAWNKYGEKNFKFDYLEWCDIEKLNEREQYWISYYKCNYYKYNSGYNLTDGGDSGHPSRKELTGTYIVNNGIDIQKYIKPSELEYYESLGFQRGLLPKNKEKTRKNHKSLKGKDSPRYGKTWSSEAREKFYNTIKDKDLSKTHYKVKVEKYDMDNNIIQIYESVKDASKENNISKGNIVACCRGRRKTAGCFKWRYVNE